METVGSNPENIPSQEKLNDIQQLEDARYSYSDEIPEEIIHFGEFKVRKAWWAAIGWIIMFIGRDYLVSQEVRERILSFKREFQNDDFVARLTTKEDIDKANEFLDFLIAELKK